MEIKDIVYALIVNIALLAIIANLLSSLQVVQRLILQERRGVKGNLFLSLIFGGLIILSTCIGVDVGSYSLNTRVIGAMSAGLLGGPLVGLYSSVIGAFYVLIFSTPRVFARGSAFATILFGLLGAGFYPYFQRGKWKYTDLFLLACFAEVCEMASLLRMTVSLEVAIDAIVDVALPMILMNAVGIIVFISNFNGVFIFQDLESSKQIQKLSVLSEKCLPLLQDGGLYKEENMKKLADIILKETQWSGILFTDREKVLQWKCNKKDERNITYRAEYGDKVPEICRQAMDEGTLVKYENGTGDKKWLRTAQDYSISAVPFRVKDQSVGSMTVWMKRQWMDRQSELELLQHLMTLGSSQLAILELEQQKNLLAQAEFKALQFQVSPHFLFNALNTISWVCREDPKEARKLLLTLADYFRYNLNYDAYMVPLCEELEHVKDYLQIEKARFEEKLQVVYDVPQEMEILVPTLILQPLVENAVRYGIDQTGRRYVYIGITEEADAYRVEISDHGKGFPEEVLDKLAKDEPVGSSIGLQNVHKRMKSAYGEEHGLQIQSTSQGSTVKLYFYKEGKEE